MIVLGKATAPKAASATSTYPAIIVSIGTMTSNSSTIKLWFYCPATMTGQPKDAKNPGGNNVVDAPIKPHDGDIQYNYQVGGVIMISYADGNLNTPQFVRYVSISDDVVKQNSAYVGGDAIIAGGILDLFDTNLTLETDILQKALSLLPAVRYCAKGANLNYDEYYIYKNVAPVEGIWNDTCVFFSEGIYGTEFLTRDHPNFFNSGYVPLNYLYKTNDIYTTDTSFLKFCTYLFSGGVYIEDPLTLLDVFVETYNKTFSSNVTKHLDSIEKDEYHLLYLMQAFAGLDSWEEGGKLINPAVFQENQKQNEGKVPETTLTMFDGHVASGKYEKDWSYLLDDFYSPSPTGGVELYQYTKFRTNFWKIFTKKYRKELDRYYVICLHNNIYRLKQYVGIEDATNILLLIYAVIATAYPILEHAIIEDDSDVFSTWNKKYDETLKKLKDLLLEKDLTIEKVKQHKEEISYFFSHMAIVIMNQEGNYNNIQQSFKHNIEVAFDWIINNADDLLNVFGETITGIPEEGYPTITDNERANQVVRIAKEQLTNSSDNHYGGEKFISWWNSQGYNNFPPGTAWCAIFATYCLVNAGVSYKSAFVPQAGCTTWTGYFKDAGRFKYKSEYTPKPGDLIMYNWDNDGWIDHVGIVESVSNGYVHTIEGNTGYGICDTNDYPLTMSSIVGYCIPLYNWDGSN